MCRPRAYLRRMMSNRPTVQYDDDAMFSRIARRLLPLLFLCYIVAYLDRVNVGFAKLQMAAELQWSDAIYGFGAGIFFLGYFLFEVPSNLLLERVGARRWIARIMISWGIISSLFAFVDRIPWGPLPAMFGVAPDVFGFYALRLLLGIAEAGFFPGIILYLTYWFPAARRARTVAWFMTAIAFANVIGGPLSGLIMDVFDGSGAWSGWRWLFVLEGIPSVFMGVAVLRWLPDGPRQASWLSAHDCDVVERRLAADQEARTSQTQAAGREQMSGGHGPATVKAAMTDRRVWALAFVYFAGTVSLYGVNFWMPTLIQELGIDRTAYLRVGLLSMIPWGVAGLAMVWAGQNSDRTGERRWHVAGALAVTAAGHATLSLVGHAVIPSLIGLALVASGVLAFFATFWSLPTSFLQRSAAAAGIAWINSIGNLGGHFGPDLIGRVRAATGGTTGAFLALGALALLGMAVTLGVTRKGRTGL
ncbi:major facilitator superfamily protein [Gemmatimonas aurantiaca T-27]|uniref:Major facilitator superfamily protein n=2 Tax=Gemmatimonas aurantiaca TaxID=173480 RepID=C1AEC8_GEMAT|nr:major facilitator superfamily protein [Gemmatimonas aurantiaca T-27]